MKAEEYLIQLAKTKDPDVIGKLLGKATRDIQVNPDIYAVMCQTAKDKGFKFKNLQLP